MQKAIRRGDLFYADLNPVVGSEQGGIRLSLLSKMMWGITLVLPLLRQLSPAEKRKTVCLPYSAGGCAWTCHYLAVAVGATADNRPEAAPWLHWTYQQRENAGNRRSLAISIGIGYPNERRTHNV